MNPGTTAPPLQLSEASRTTFDLARGLAAQVVLLGHAFDFFNVFSFLGQPDPPPQIQRLAVVGFFLLSGFLIARSLHGHLARSTTTFGDYLADRAARIYSGLIPALVLIAALDALPMDLFELDYFEGDTSYKSLLANLLHLQFFPGLNLGAYGTGIPLWTLGIEWWLYVTAGALCLGFRRGRIHLLALALILPGLASVGYNLLGGEGYGIALTWLLGALAYAASVRLVGDANFGTRSVNSAFKSSWITWLVASLTAAALGIFRLASLGPDTPAKAFDRGFAVAAALAFFLGLQAVQRGGRPPAWLKRVAAVLASFSYTLYLIHFTVLTVFYEWRSEIPDVWLLVAAVIASNLLAVILSFAGERQRKVFRGVIRPRTATH